MAKIPQHLEIYFTQQVLARLEPDRANTWQVVGDHIHVYDEDGWLYKSNKPTTQPPYSDLGMLLTVHGFIHAREHCVTNCW